MGTPHCSSFITTEPSRTMIIGSKWLMPAPIARTFLLRSVCAYIMYGQEGRLETACWYLSKRTENSVWFNAIMSSAVTVTRVSLDWRLMCAREATRANGVSRGAAAKTWAPASASAAAAARPMPRPAPVTSARRPSSLNVGVLGRLIFLELRRKA